MQRTKFQDRLRHFVQLTFLLSVMGFGVVNANAEENKDASKTRIGAVTVLTDNYTTMVAFYKDVFSFELKTDNGEYAEFLDVPFAIAHRQTLKNASGHSVYLDKPSGQSYEIAFAVSSPEMVDSIFRKAIEHGGRPIKQPLDTSWGQRIAFFQDPDGNVHDIYSQIAE